MGSKLDAISQTTFQGAGQPDAIAALDHSVDPVGTANPVLSGISVVAEGKRPLTPAAAAANMFIEWVTA